MLALPSQAAAAARPNIVLIVADDLGYTDLGSYGGEIRTPNLDTLAAEGTRFASFHVAGECSPTRAMLLTGLNSHRSGVGAMRESVPREFEGKPGYLTVLDRKVVTLSSLLQRGGYRTYAVGKWHVGKESYNLPPARGFDRSLVQGDSGSDNWDPAQRYLALTDRVYWFEDGAPARMPKEYYSTSFFVDKALEYLQQDWATRSSTSSLRDGPQPFFLYLAFQANHIPLQAPAAFVAKQQGRYDVGWEVIRARRHQRAMELGLLPPDTALAPWPGLADWDGLDASRRAYDARRMEVYAAMAEAMDEQIGRLRAAIRQLGQDENTVFIFLSDNGAEPSDPYEYLTGKLWLATQYSRELDALGAKGAYTTIGYNWASAAVSPLATHKFYAGEGGLRVPLIVRGPALLPQGASGGRIFTGLTHVTDITPTLLDIAGIPYPDGRIGAQPLAGRSLLPVLRGVADRARMPTDPIGYELAGNAALFAGDLKLVRNQPPVGNGEWQLFNIARDPGETRDLRAVQPEEFARLLDAYRRFERDENVLPLPEGYEPRRQVTLNALRRVILPSLAWPGIAVLIAGLGVWIWWRRRRARQETSRNLS
jgi:arylsulfatase/uncharacterized sulfatase